MFESLFKLFIEEPDKQNKFFSALLRFLFCILFTAFLHKLIIGDFQSFDPVSLEEWSVFASSGRLIVCLLLFFVTRWFIYSMISLIGMIPIWLTSKIRGELLDRHQIRWMLSLFDIVSFTKNGEMPVPGRNIDVLHDITKSVEGSDGKTEWREFKQSYINTVWTLSVAFVLLYFLQFRTQIDNPLITTLAVLWLCLIFLFYLGIHIAMEYMFANHAELEKGLRYIKLYHTASEIFKEYGVPVISRSSKGIEFNLKGNDYFLVIHPGGQLFSMDRIVSDAKRLAKKGKRILAILNTERDEAKKNEIQRYQNFLTLICSVDEQDIKNKLKIFLES